MKKKPKEEKHHEGDIPTIETRTACLQRVLAPTVLPSYTALCFTKQDLVQSRDTLFHPRRFERFIAKFFD